MTEKGGSLVMTEKGKSLVMTEKGKSLVMTGKGKGVWRECGWRGAERRGSLWAAGCMAERRERWLSRGAD